MLKRHRFARAAGAFLLAAGLLAGAAPLGAQLPRPQYPKTMTNPASVSKWITSATFPRSVTVCPAFCDYATIGAAVTYVTAQSPTAAAPWVITVEPGTPGVNSTYAAYNYSETSIVVPPFTMLQGAVRGHPSISATLGVYPVVLMTGTTGKLVRLQSGSAISGLWFQYRPGIPGATALSAAMTGDVVVISADAGSGFAPILSDVVVSVTSLGTGASARRIDAFANDSGSSYAYGLSVGVANNSIATAVTNRNNSAGAGASIYNGRFTCAGCGAVFENLGTSGGFTLWSVRVDSGATVDFANTGGGAFSVNGTTYGPTSGTITPGATHEANGTTNPATCSIGQVFVNTTGAAEKICFCTALNTWKCAAGS